MLFGDWGQSCFRLQSDNNYFKFGVEAVHAFEGSLDKWVKWSSAVLQVILLTGTNCLCTNARDWSLMY
jgi:hypothetical protein